MDLYCKFISNVNMFYNLLDIFSIFTLVKQTRQQLASLYFSLMLLFLGKSKFDRNFKKALYYQEDLKKKKIAGRT